MKYEFDVIEFDGTDNTDVKEIKKLITKKSKIGWELITHTFVMMNMFGQTLHYFTFKREKKTDKDN